MTPLRSIQEHVGSLFDVPRGILVHGCNAQGVMGAGIAVIVRRLFPEAYRVYRSQYEAQGLKVGEIIPVTVKSDASGAPELIVVNAITQEFTGTDRVQVDYVAISTCFEQIAVIARQSGLAVHFPLIGCGLAGGDWRQVAPRILAALQEIPAHLWVPPTKS